MKAVTRGLPTPRVTMPAYWFALVVTTLAAASLPVAARGASGLSGLLATGGMVLAWGVMAKLAARAAACRLAGGAAAASDVARRLDRTLAALRWAWLPVLAVCLAGFGAATALESLPGPDRSLALRGLLLLLPSVAVAGLLLLAEDQFVTWARDDREDWRPMVGRITAALRLQAAWLIAPLVLVLIVIDIGNGLFGADAAVAGPWSGAVALAMLPLALPWIVCRVWKTAPPVDPWPAEMARAAGVGGLCIRRWDTDGRLCTAVVVGFFPGCRVLLLSDELLRLLSRPQLAMVVLHEVAHLRRWHLPLRLAALLPAWIAAAAAASLAPPVPGLQPAAMAVGLVATVLLLRAVAHRTELDADRVACRLAAQAGAHVTDVPATPAAAAITLAAALRRVTGDDARARRGGWMHPGLDRRLAALARVAESADAIPATPGAAYLSPLSSTFAVFERRAN